jgi:tetratricopeptide (TPR) repeat protein
MRPVTERFLGFRRASSGLNSTAEDLARWVIALTRRRLLDSASMATMWTPVAFNDGTPGQWALGWMVLPRGKGRAIGMTGGGRAAVFVYPEHDVAVAVLTNLAGAFPEDFVDGVAAIYAPDLRLSGVPALRLALDERGYQHAAEVAARIARADPALVWNEAELNDWGYRLLSSGRPREGLEVLKLVASLFPRSANAFDSLAEAYAANGDRASAIANYERSLALDPSNRNAAERLRALRGAP